MSVMTIDALCIALAAVVGVATGMWLRRGSGGLHESSAEFDERTAQAQTILYQVHALIAGMAAQVGEHNDRVLEISNELQEVDEPDSTVVVTAIANLIQANEEMRKQLEMAEGRLQEQAEQLEISESLARTDALTGLLNRRAIDVEMERCVEQLKRYGQPSTVLMMDADHFKRINDLHGHQRGDEILRGLSARLQAGVRRTDHVARYGGEEFCIIFPGARLQDCMMTAEAIRSAISQAPFEFDELSLRVTASGGLAELMPGETPSSFIERADDALYISKEAGRDCAHWHDGRGIHAVEIPQDAESDAESDAASDLESDAEFNAELDTESNEAVESQETPTASDRSEREIRRAGDKQLSNEVRGVSKDADKSTTDDETLTRPAATSEATTHSSTSTARKPSTKPTPDEKPCDEAHHVSTQRDLLTGLSLRESFCDDIRRHLATLRRNGSLLFVAVARIDNYAAILELHGREGGDLALRAASQFFKTSVREMDHAARFDANTFALMVPGATLANGSGVIERLRKAIARCQLPLSAGELQFTISVGGTESTPHDTVDTVLRRAFSAMNAAASDEKNRCYTHDGRRAVPVDTMEVVSG